MYQFLGLYLFKWWHWSSNGDVFGRVNQVALRRARLVLRWVTVRRDAVFACNQPLQQTQLPALSGKEMSTGQMAVLCDREGNRRSDVALTVAYPLTFYVLSGLQKGR